MINKLDPTKVIGVYSGREGNLGKYSYTEAGRLVAGQERGYEVTDDEINDRMVNKVVKYINEHLAEVEVIDDNVYSVTLPSGLIYTAYLAETKA